jgi:Protein of unknown function (DUF2924)
MYLTQLAALSGKSTAELKQWRDLYDREPPPYNKPFLVKRLAYRIQELAYGGLSARAEAKLKELVEEEDRRLTGKLPVRKGDGPITGTRLIREWQILCRRVAWGKLRGVEANPEDLR